MHPSPRSYVATWAALMLLSGITLALARVPLGEPGTVLALGLASAKALLIAVFFMHLIEQRSVNALFLSIALVLVLAFVALSAMDVGTRGDAVGELPAPVAAPEPARLSKVR